MKTFKFTMSNYQRCCVWHVSCLIFMAIPACATTGHYHTAKENGSKVTSYGSSCSFIFPQELVNSDGFNAHYIVTSFIISVYMICGMQQLADNYFIPCYEVIWELTSIEANVAGATFLGIGTSLVSVLVPSVALITHSGVDVSDVCVTALFKLLASFGISVLMVRYPVSVAAYPIVRDSIFHIVGLFLLSNVVIYKKSHKIIGASMLFLYLLYLLVLYKNQYWRRTFNLSSLVKKRPRRDTKSMRKDLDFRLNIEILKRRRIARLNKILFGEPERYKRKASTSSKVEVDTDKIKVLTKTVDEVPKKSVHWKTYASLYYPVSYSALYVPPPSPLSSLCFSFGSDDQSNSPSTYKTFPSSKTPSTYKDSDIGNIDSSTNVIKEKTLTLPSSRLGSHTSIIEIELNDVQPLDNEDDELSSISSTSIESPVPSEGPFIIPESTVSSILWVLTLPFACLHYLTIPDSRKPQIMCHSKLVFLTWFISSAYLTAYNYVILWMINNIIIVSDLPMFTHQIVLTGIGMGIPSLYCSIHLLRKGYGNVTMANIFGGNIFGILVGTGIPFLVGNGQVDIKLMNDSHVILVCSTIYSIVLIGFLFKYSHWIMSKCTGVMCLIVYLVIISTHIVLQCTLLEYPMGHCTLGGCR